MKSEWKLISNENGLNRHQNKLSAILRITTSETFKYLPAQYYAQYTCWITSKF